MNKYSPERIKELLAAARAQVASTLPLEEKLNELVSGTTSTSNPASNPVLVGSAVSGVSNLDGNSTQEERTENLQTTGNVDHHGGKILGVARDDLIYNDKQQDFINRGSAGEDLVLIGAAGTGKTTCQRGLGKKLIRDGKIKPLSRSTKWLKAGSPGVAVVSFTNKAVNNIRHALPDDIKAHALTIHKLLEYAPVMYEIDDPENPGKFKITMRFEPQRNRYNPLPSDLKLIIIEESSMVGVELHDKLLSACPHKPQVIYLGDIQQLPPVFDSSILGFKMLELPVIELTEVYRQAMGPILNLAWTILEGNPKSFDGKTKVVEKEINGKKTKRITVPALELLSKETPNGTVIFQPWQKQLSADLGLLTLVKQFNEWSDKGYYNHNDDIILCPFNVSFGTIEINKGISQHLGRKRGAVVYEVVAGYNKHYLAEEDRVLYAKEDAFITKIVHNGEYLGKSYQTNSPYLDRWGNLRAEDMPADELGKLQDATNESTDFDLEAIEKYIDAAAKDTDERVAAASHIITIKNAVTGDEQELTTAAEINNLLGGYCITVHKAQGSEWDKVFLVMQHTHATMNQRELLYTAVTRARKHLHIICEPTGFEKGIQSQKIKGNTLAEKAEFFKGKVEERDKLLAARAAAMQTDPINLAFAKVSEWDSLARDSITHWWKLAQKLYPEKLALLPTPIMTWKIKGSAAGYANVHTREIGLSPVYLHLDPANIISDTIPHEIAHIVAWIVGNDRGHGGMWKRVMEKFGKNPVESHYHDLGKLPTVLRKIMEDSATEGGINPDEEV
jgi:hypothetical protein